MLKPDAVQRGLIGKVMLRFEKKGFKLVAMKACQPSREHFEAHYSDLIGKSFFAGLMEYITSGPVIAMVWEGNDVIATGRTLLGKTNPADSAPGTIRFDYSIRMGRNIIHGSDSLESAQKEIAMWFPDGAKVGICTYDNHSEA